MAGSVYLIGLDTHIDNNTMLLLSSSLRVLVFATLCLLSVHMLAVLFGVLLRLGELSNASWSFKARALAQLLRTDPACVTRGLFPVEVALVACDAARRAQGADALVHSLGFKVY